MDKNNPDSNNRKENPSPAQERLERLSRYSSDKPAEHSAGYTSFIRRMRLVLPLVAISIVVALLTWPDSQSKIAILEESQKESLQTIRKNELTSPKFESVDNKNQPYTITAEKTVQSDSIEDIMLLDKPLADMQLKSGSWVALKADNGKYWQKKGELDLQNNVSLFHDDGYEMNTASLFIDLKEKTARSDTDVSGHGPAGTLQAKGLKGDNVSGILVFLGPAKLVLKDGGSLQGLADTGNATVPGEKIEATPGQRPKTNDITEQPQTDDE